MSGATRRKILCVRPIHMPLGSRAGRDAARRRDPVLCRCGGEYCRDRELLPQNERPTPEQPP